MTQEQVTRILTDICEDNEKNDGCVKVEIMHGHNSYTVIDARNNAWDINDGILMCCTDHGTRWVDVESIHCIGI